MDVPGEARRGRSGGCRLLLPILLCCSCSGSGLNSVQGKVLYQGSPIAGAVVVFHPKGGNEVTAQRPSAVTREDGTFSLATGKRAGAPAGEYAVTVVWPGEPPRKAGGQPLSTEADEPSAPDRLAGRYANYKTTTLSAVVRSGRNKLEPFDLK
jgi:hypothetical protein